MFSLAGEDSDSVCSTSSSSSTSSFDEDRCNTRLNPDWSVYRTILESNGYRLETVRDVRDYYRHHSIERRSLCPSYRRAYALHDENALCGDPGLPSNLFRATRCQDGTRLVVKAVHLLSRELTIAQYVSSPALLRDPMNHCIPILAFIEVPSDQICFIVMQEWSSHLMSCIPINLHEFLSTIRQCIEHVVFMHKHHIAHLDISMYNFVTDFRGHCACFDYELSRAIDAGSPPQMLSPRGTEIPPELECGQTSNLYAVDVWALAKLILGACNITGFLVPKLIQLVRPMLNECPEKRPTAAAVLWDFERLLLPEEK